MEIVTLQGDLLQAAADAIVSPSNSLGDMSTGVAWFIKRAGGAVIEDEAKSKAPIPIGEAVYTTAGELPFKYIIHSPTMEKPSEKTTIERVRQATVAALLCADSVGVKTLAMPGMGTGAGGISAAGSAEVMVETLRHYETASIRKIILIDRSPEVAQAFQDALFAERG